MRNPQLIPFFCIALLVLHWLNQWYGTYPLMFDEAQYWFWAKHPAWGYYSKPPVIGWLIAASTHFFGDGTFGVKMLAPVLTLFTGLMLYATTLRLKYSELTASWVLITYLTIPLITGHALFFSTDVPLEFFWAVAMYGVISALVTERPRYWLLAGAAAGLGLLSKYTMVAFAASTLLAIITTPAYRAQLRRPWPWAAALLALVIFAPNLIWNAHHQFVTFQHTDDNVFSKTIELYPEDMLAFIGAQFGLFGPILLVSLLLSLRRPTAPAKLLHCFVWPLAIVGIIVALLAGAQAHWIGPVYLAGTLIAVPWLVQNAPRWLSRSFGLNMLVLVLAYAAPLILPHLPVNPFDRVFMWNDLAQAIRPYITKYPNAVLITDERKIAAATTYQLRDLRGTDTPVYKWNPNHLVHDHYDMLTEQVDLKGKDLLLVARHLPPGGFEHQKHIIPLSQPTVDGYRFTVYLIPSFPGYE